MNGLRALGRALRLRCPVCGKAPVMASWFKARRACSSCGFHFDRFESGYEVGSLAVNTAVTLVSLVVGIPAAIALSWPSPNYEAITIGTVIVAVLLPFVLFPWSKTLYLALDVSFRVPTDDDFTARPPA
ncbi:MAG: DUF983 domain-containing protein [Gemmatimonadota bacterium]